MSSDGRRIRARGPDTTNAKPRRCLSMTWPILPKMSGFYRHIRERVSRVSISVSGASRVSQLPFGPISATDILTRVIPAGNTGEPGVLAMLLAFRVMLYRLNVFMGLHSRQRVFPPSQSVVSNSVCTLRLDYTPWACAAVNRLVNKFYQRDEKPGNCQRLSDQSASNPSYQIGFKL